MAPENPGDRFVAITDPGSKMEQVAKNDGFRYIFYGDPQIGVLPPGALELRRGRGHRGPPPCKPVVRRSRQGRGRSQTARREQSRRAVGLLLGSAANAGRDKLTISTSPEIYDLGAGWSN